MVLVSLDSRQKISECILTSAAARVDISLVIGTLKVPALLKKTQREIPLLELLAVKWIESRAVNTGMIDSGSG